MDRPDTSSKAALSHAITRDTDAAEDAEARRQESGRAWQNRSQCPRGVAGLLRRELPDRADPVLDVVGADHPAALDGVNIDRHHLE